MKYRIGTRGSKLALAQTETVRARLAAAYPGDTFETVVIKTHGDLVTDRPLAELGEAAPFVREIERALLDGRVDFAVHSMKDLAAECPEGLVLSKAWPREDPRDVLVCRTRGMTLDSLPRGAVVATGSVRRAALLLAKRPDLEIAPLRGNVDTRLRKVRGVPAEAAGPDAVVLAAAGLIRLGLTDEIDCFLDPEWMVPSPNQGQLAIELRAADTGLKAKLDALGDDDAEAAAYAERLFLRETGADCHRPVGALARFDGGRFAMRCVTGTSKDDLVFETRTAGTVTLVGAGPGDPGLITVKGLEAVRSADCIVYDRLACPGLLDEARDGCVRIYAGKACGRHALPQNEINALLFRLSLVHGRVVRLKGGDPFVFGRGAEEMAYLTERGTVCSVVPGVTSAVAAAESVHIPVTSRGVATGFEAVTAHGKDDTDAGIDFSRMLDPERTYVFMMGLGRVGEIASSLVAAGRVPGTPVAVVSSATTPDGRCVVGTLADIAGRVAEAALESPAVVVVGDVVTLRRDLGFPLSGGRYLVPVVEGGSTGIAEQIRRLGGIADEVVVGRVVLIDGAFSARDLDGIDRIVVTSRNGRRALEGEMGRIVSARGIPVEYVKDVRAVGKTLHLTQPDADRVEGVRSIDVYRNEPVTVPEPIDLDRYDAALFTCASSARRVYASATGSTLAVAIGPKTAAALAGLGVSSVVTAGTRSVASMLEELVRR